MSVMGQKGDTKISWDPNVPEEVEAAKAAFRLFLRRGFAAFASKPAAAQKFDPQAGGYSFKRNVTAEATTEHEQVSELPETGDVMMIPPMKGG